MLGNLKITLWQVQYILYTYIYCFSPFSLKEHKLVKNIILNSLNSKMLPWGPKEYSIWRYISAILLVDAAFVPARPPKQ